MASSQNAFEYLTDINNKCISSRRIGVQRYEIVEFNDIPCPFLLSKKKDRVAICITRIHSCLNPVKSADSCAKSWFEGKMNHFIGLDSDFNCEEDAEEYRVRGTNDYSGYYVDFTYELLLFTLGSMAHKLAAWKWFNGLPDWDVEDGDGIIYLIHVRSKGSNVFKYGKTIYLIARLRVYLRNEPEDFRKLGIIKLCIMKVKNTSDAEQKMGQEFAKLKGCEIVDGNEYVKVPGKDFNEAAQKAVKVFETVRDKLGSDVYKNSYEKFEGEESVFQLEKDKN